MPIDFFRWEEGGALVHHCPQCQTPLTNKRTKLRCLGHHVGWCKRYHCQLFKKGGSAVCMGCKGSDEQRYNRYKEIAELVKELRIIANEHSAALPTTPAPPKFDHAVHDGSTSKKDRKEAKRVAKAAGRALAIRAKDIERIGRILHPQQESVDEEFERALLRDKSIEDNVYVHPGTSNSREEILRIIRQERSSKSELEVSEAEMYRIMSELRVPDLAQVKSKSERGIVTRLREKIVEDLVHDHGEAGETMKRKAGFWRWANREAYNRLVANGRIWDWKNGEALARVVEHEAVVEDEGEAQATPGAEQEAAVEQEHTDKDDEGNSDLSSVVSFTSEVSRFRITKFSSSVSRDTSISSASRTTVSSHDEGADDGWTTVGRSKPASAAISLKLSTNGGLRHLKSKTTPRTPKSLHSFSMLTIEDSEKGYKSDEDDAVSPRTPCPKRR